MGTSYIYPKHQNFWLIDGKPVTPEDLKKELWNQYGKYTSREQKEGLLEKRVSFDPLHAAIRLLSFGDCKIFVEYQNC